MKFEQQQLEWMKLSRYFPYRFAASRYRYLPNFLRTYRMEFDGQPPGMLDGYAPLAAIDPLIGMAFRKVVSECRGLNDYAKVTTTCMNVANQLGLEEDSDHVFDRQVKSVILDERRLATHYASLHCSGYRLYDFSDQLLTSFKRTSCGDVKLADVQLPYATIYLHFGHQLDRQLYGSVSKSGVLAKMLNPEAFLDSDPSQMLQLMACVNDEAKDLKYKQYYLVGAYVSRALGGSLDVVFIADTVPLTPAKANWLDYPVDILHTHLPNRWDGITVLESMELEQREIQVETVDVFRQKISGRDMEDMLENQSDRMTGDLVQTLRDNLHLVVNSILYLTNYREFDVEEDYAEEAPARLTAKADTSAKARAELKEKGFRKIYFCGRKPTIDVTPIVEATEKGTHKSPEPHSRGGHYRTYRRGTAEQYKRWIWEVFVNADKADETGKAPVPVIYQMRDRLKDPDVETKVTAEMEQDILSFAAEGIPLDEIALTLKLPEEAVIRLIETANTTGAQ